MVIDERLRRRTATVVGVVVTVCTILAGWREGANHNIAVAQWATQGQITDIATAVEAYQKRTHKLPNSIGNLIASDWSASGRISPSAAAWMQRYGSGSYFNDTWSRPLIYRRTKTGFVVLSYGRDGMPGGVGLDCDLSNLHPNPPQAAIPFSQFLADQSAGKVIPLALLAGVLTGFACRSSIKPGQNLGVRLAVKMVWMLLVSIGFGIFIMLVYAYPSH